MLRNIEGSKRPQRLTSYVVLISDTELSLFVEANSYRFEKMPCWMNTKPIMKNSMWDISQA